MILQQTYESAGLVKSWQIVWWNGQNLFSMGVIVSWKQDNEVEKLQMQVNWVVSQCFLSQGRLGSDGHILYLSCLLLSLFSLKYILVILERGREREREDRIINDERDHWSTASCMSPIGDQAWNPSMCSELEVTHPGI